MSPAKVQAQSLVDNLPNDCTFEDIHYHLYVLEKVQKGLEAVDQLGGLPHQEVVERLKKWADTAFFTQLDRRK